MTITPSKPNNEKTTTPELAVDYLDVDDYCWEISRSNFYSLRNIADSQTTYNLLEPLLLNYPKTKSPRIPLAVKWLGNERAIKPLMSLILDTRTDGCRSALIYAISDFNPVDFIEVFVDLLISGEYDIVRDCANVIDGLDGDPGDEVLDRCSSKLLAAYKNKENEENKNIILYFRNDFRNRNWNTRNQISYT